MAEPCYNAYSCPVGPQSAAKPVRKTTADGIVPNIAIQLNAEGEFIDALWINTEELVESAPVPIINSGETDCAKARLKYGL